MTLPTTPDSKAASPAAVAQTILWQSPDGEQAVVIMDAPADEKLWRRRRRAARQKIRKQRACSSQLTGIDAAVEALVDFKLAGTRGAEVRSCQLRKAVETLREVKGGSGRADALGVKDVTADDVKRAIALWRGRDKLAAGTINARLSLLSALGIDCKGLWRDVRLPPKWWLSPDKLATLLAWLREPGEGQRMLTPSVQAGLMADYVEFIAWTGLRVEEALRLTWRNVRLDLRPGNGDGDSATLNASEITVPGTKTDGAQASLAISLIPALVLQRRLAEAPDTAALVFPVTYRDLKAAWQHCRAFLGEEGSPLATLRALRRTAARNLTIKGMPTEILRAYLRHSNIKTTMGYLRLVGGYSTAEQRRWL